jgi:hypothetical protein
MHASRLSLSDNSSSSRTAGTDCPGSRACVRAAGRVPPVNPLDQLMVAKRVRRSGSCRSWCSNASRKCMPVKNAFNMITAVTNVTRRHAESRNLCCPPRLDGISSALGWSGQHWSTCVALTACTGSRIAWNNLTNARQLSRASGTLD